uniref:FBD domain-containing protein n=1 Tax=Oryza rufipogon TaxID=4529 RepID=A0A0E0QVV5_ORYRU
MICKRNIGDEQLETGCPALEDLSFHDCFIFDGEVSSQTLKISISTPSVTSLTLDNPMDGIVVLKDMKSLVRASVRLNRQWPHDDFDARDLRNYLWTLSGIENLKFYCGRRKS